MPLKPHPTDPDKMVYASPHYDLPDTPTAKTYLAKVLEDEDDDIQVYKRPWVDLTDEEISEIAINNPPMVHEFARAVLAKSKDKNNG